MAKFNYVAMDSTGKETKGVLDVGSQAEALNRLKEMGFLPTKVTEVAPPKSDAKGGKGAKKKKGEKKKGEKEKEEKEEEKEKEKELTEKQE